MGKAVVIVAKNDFVNYHLREALNAAVAELDGDEDLSRQLHAETKVRLMYMTDEELWELAKITSSPPETPVELAYEQFKQKIEELKATTSQWIKNLRYSAQDKGMNNGR